MEILGLCLTLLGIILAYIWKSNNKAQKDMGQMLKDMGQMLNEISRVKKK